MSDVPMTGLRTVLRGERVVLEPIEASHEDALWEAATEDPAIWRWMKADYSASRERFRAFETAIRSHRAGQSRAPYRPPRA